jgi:hypothetical protein
MSADGYMAVIGDVIIEKGALRQKTERGDKGEAGQRNKTSTHRTWPTQQVAFNRS